MPRLPVVFVSSVFDEVREGPAIYARYLRNYFDGHDQIDFHLVVPEVSEPADNIHVSGFGASSLETYRRLQRRALDVASSLDNALVHGNSAHTMWLFRRYSGPLLVQVNDYDPADVFKHTRQYVETRMFRRFLSLVWRHIQERRVIKHADAVVCNSRFTLNALRKSYSVPASQMEVIYKAVDTDAFRRPAELPADPYPSRTKGKRLIFVGTNWRRKGLDTLLRALLVVREAHPGISLDIVGPKQSDLSESVRQFIIDHALAANLSISGVVGREALPTHFWHADLCVLPSNEEALGVSILEALAAGVPVLATEVGGIPEILDQKPCGRMVTAGNSAGLAEEILALMADPQKLKLMGVAGVDRAAEFSSIAMLKRIEALYLRYKNSV